MIYITGDCHGEYTRLNNTNFPVQENMTKDDFVIVLGDFGFWDNSIDQQWWRAWLNSKNFTTLFIDGNHENYDLLSTYPVEEWNGGKVQKILPTVIHLMRGQVYNLYGYKFFTFGGAKSHDADVILQAGMPRFRKMKQSLLDEGTSFRVNHQSWWKEEMPNAAEYAEGLKNLKAADNKVDYILTHCAPSSVQMMMNRNFEIDELTKYLENIHQTVDYKKWFFGHYHTERDFFGKDECLYFKIVQIA